MKRELIQLASDRARPYNAGTVLSDIAKSRADIEASRFLVLAAANQVSLPQVDVSHAVAESALTSFHAYGFFLRG